MEKSRAFFRKSAVLLSALLLLSSPCFSQEFYSISADELERIQLDAAQMMLTIENQKSTIERQKEVTERYRTLSDELGQENERLTKSRDRWRAVAIGLGCGAAACAGLAILMRK